MNRDARAALVAVVLVMSSCATAPARRPLPPEPGAHPSAAFASPLPGFEVLSKFGPRPGHFHTGIDLRARRGGGDPVLAARDGRVVRAETRSGYGRMVELVHDDGFSTRYAHLRRIDVKLGQRVRQGDRIGIVGSTGRATTAHLHFEVLTPGYRFVDPAIYLFPSRK